MRLVFHKGERLESPVCGAGTKFRDTVLKYGIYIPKVCSSNSAPDKQQQEQQSTTQTDTYLQEAEDLENLEHHVSCSLFCRTFVSTWIVDLTSPNIQ